MPASGELLADRYRILAPLGAGGMATVYRAHDERLGREVAVKILLPNLAGDPVLATRFEREARTLAAAAHPGVVSIYDVDAGDPSSGREPFFVMELCPGGSLADRLVGGQRVTPDELVPTLVSIADGLADLHARGVVHRDVKPSNILFAADRAKLADFGLARADTDELDDLTSPGTAVGTMAYLAPEVLAGKTAESAADIYALGVAGYVGLTGRVPRPASSLTELASTAGEPAPTVSAAVPDLGRAFDEPIAAALEPDPARRPDALDFASSMTAALGGWGRSRPPNVTAAAPPTSEADLATDATTKMAVPTMSAPPSEPPAEGDAQPSRLSLGLAAGTVVAVLAGIAVWALLGAGLRPGSTGPSAPAVASEATSAAPTTAQTASPSLSAPSAPSIADRALAALDEVDAAISATAGKDGLKGNERNELEQRAGAVRSALVAGDLDTARKAAKALADRIDEHIDELDEQRARRLEDAVSGLIDILGADE
jgi:serine/threonine protein kinase